MKIRLKNEENYKEVDRFYIVIGDKHYNLEEDNGGNLVITGNLNGLMVIPSAHNEIKIIYVEHVDQKQENLIQKQVIAGNVIQIIGF